MVRTWWSELILSDDSVDSIYTVVVPKSKTSFNYGLQENSRHLGRVETSTKLSVWFAATELMSRSKIREWGT